MTPKLMMFFSSIWFESTVICTILEGSYLGSYQQSIWGEIMSIGTLNIFNMFDVLPGFFHGIWRMLIWDYSFYQGGYAFLRWFWFFLFGVGALWGIFTVMAPIIVGAASFIKNLFHIPGL